MTVTTAWWALHYCSEITAKTEQNEQEHCYGGSSGATSLVVFAALIPVRVPEHLHRHASSQFVPVE